MAWDDALNGNALRTWLEQASQSRYAPERKLDLFATSMRDFNDVAPQLENLYHGRDVGHTGRSGQRLTDLRGARLVERGGNGLTALGLAVRARWTHYGVADSSHDHELHRELIILIEALRLRDSVYEQIIAYWRELRAVFGADELIDNWDKLYAITCLDHEYDGFSPGQILKAAKIPLTEIDADLAPVASRLTGASPKVIDGARRITEAVQSETPRGRHRATFCLAMELLLSDLHRADQLLARFGVPDRPRVWTPFSMAAKELCKKILRDAGAALDISDLIPLADPILAVLADRKNVILYGPPGTGKTRAALATADVWKSRNGPTTVFAVTFHPSYSYEDFVWGFRPTPDGKFAPTAGVLLQACECARTDPTLLVIDEINRADTARAFGELITYVESDKRGREFRIAQDPTRTYNIPVNLNLLCTMNTADRSISLLDVALRRRFAFIGYYPDATAFTKAAGWLSTVGDVALEDVLETLNRRLTRIGVEPDRAIGQALLSVSSTSADPAGDLHKRFRYDIHPLITDYCFSDRAKVHDILRPLVDADGKLVTTNDDFIEKLRAFVGAQPREGAIEEADGRT